jgi:hypothetical protein
MPKKSDLIKQSSVSDKIRVAILSELEDLVAASGGPAGATEATLLSVLNAIVASDQDIEILLVRDTGDSDKVLQQITNYETGTPVVIYKDVNGNVVVPVGPLEYLDPSAVLQLILADTTALATPSTSVATTLDVITGAGASSVSAGKRTVSFMNTGNNDATVNGTVLSKGIGITYPELANRDTYAAIPYNALTSELTITTAG